MLIYKRNRFKRYIYDTDTKELITKPMWNGCTVDVKNIMTHKIFTIYKQMFFKNNGLRVIDRDDRWFKNTNEGVIVHNKSTMCDWCIYRHQFDGTYLEFLNSFEEGE